MDNHGGDRIFDLLGSTDASPQAVAMAPPSPGAQPGQVMCVVATIDCEGWLVSPEDAMNVADEALDLCLELQDESARGDGGALVEEVDRFSWIKDD